ncbi:hypothetical protein B0T24DRAFT_382998 [Lasiosphaeria ovina]|uniref:C2H2-type domain-containing protein n=1 Tax=Lasiosphaeria ovina TaxID=92902 RepID=A0AAE0JZ92_9PEZI|nr:hypothetical protein B0T24DRAFT_382998 [Lasiosphaeria ovina]
MEYPAGSIFARDSYIPGDVAGSEVVADLPDMDMAAFQGDEGMDISWLDYGMYQPRSTAPLDMARFLSQETNPLPFTDGWPTPQLMYDYNTQPTLEGVSEYILMPPLPPPPQQQEDIYPPLYAAAGPGLAMAPAPWTAQGLDGIDVDVDLYMCPPRFSGENSNNNNKACEVCGRSFARPTELERHVNTVHNKSRKLLMCPLCDPDPNSDSQTTTTAAAAAAAAAADAAAAFAAGAQQTYSRRDALQRHFKRVHPGWCLDSLGRASRLAVPAPAPAPAPAPIPA